MLGVVSRESPIEDTANTHRHIRSTRVTRRVFVIGATATMLAACTSDIGGSGAGGSSNADATDSEFVSGSTLRLDALSPSDFEGLATCQLLPATTAGPFGLDEQFDRRDITEGLPGSPVRLGVRVVDENCEPLPGFDVEVWHADATGDVDTSNENDILTGDVAANGSLLEVCDAPTSTGAGTLALANIGIVV